MTDLPHYSICSDGRDGFVVTDDVIERANADRASRGEVQVVTRRAYFTSGGQWYMGSIDSDIAAEARRYANRDHCARCGERLGDEDRAEVAVGIIHAGCYLDGDDGEPAFDCKAHGPSRVVEEVHSFIGFAGGRSYVYRLACGCQTLDESGDVAAAR